MLIGIVATRLFQSLCSQIIPSFDNKEYICSTCHSKVAKGKIPCQAVYNDMSVDEIPVELALLEKLKQILIAQRIVFEKIIIMPKGQQKKVSRAICNNQLIVIRHVKFYQDHQKGRIYEKMAPEKMALERMAPEK